MPIRSWDVEESGLRPEYHMISCELRALAKMVHQELGTKGIPSFDDDGGVLGGQRSPLFERGRFYEEYSARRNERLRRKKGEVEGYEKKPAYAYDLGVRVESAKKREATKFDSRRKAAVAAAAATPVAERREARMTPTPRYSLRSTSKENKKPPIPMSLDKSVVGITERKVRRTRKA